MERLYSIRQLRAENGMIRFYSWRKLVKCMLRLCVIQITLRFIQINMLLSVEKCVVGLSLLQDCESALNRTSLSSVLISRLDGRRSSLDVLVAHVD